MVAIARRPGELLKSELIASEEGVSKKYLDAILGRLREAGLLKTVRGSHGGYTLARPPGEIAVADVVEAQEGRIAVVPCVVDASLCERAPRCPTRGVWRETSAAIRRVLAALSLAELASREPAAETAEATYVI